MIPRRFGLALLALAVLAGVGEAQDAAQSAGKLSASVLRALENGARTVSVIVRMRGHRGKAPAGALVGATAGVKLAVRRDEARQCASGVLQFLASLESLSAKAVPMAPGQPRASSIGRTVSKPTELWLANSVCLRAGADTIHALAQRPDVERVYRDVRIQAIPTHELAGRQNVTALDTAATSSWAVETLRARSVWDTHGVRGEGVVVGHIDTGVDGTHPALAGRIHRFKDFVGGKQAAYDDEGHGTHTAGSICAGGQGIGVAPGARLLVAKALSSDGSGELSTILAAMQWMLDPDGDPSTDDRPICVSNSWGVDRQEMRAMGSEETFFWDAIQAWRDAGILPLFASGNTGPGHETVPSGYPISIAVGATDRNDGTPSFSTGGATTWNGITLIKPDIAAPGGSIVSTIPGGGLKTMSGTSMACPHAAGVVALMRQANPRATARELERALTASVVDLGPVGRDDRTGLGRIDAMAAVNAILSGPTPPTVRPPVPPPAPQPPATPPRDETRRVVSRGILFLALGLAAAFGLSLMM